MTAYIHAELPWSWVGAAPDWARLPTELSAEDRVCFTCPLPECDQRDARCPFNDDRSATKQDRRIEKRVKRLCSYWDRQIDEACRAAVREREAEGV